MTNWSPTEARGKEAKMKGQRKGLSGALSFLSWALEGARLTAEWREGKRKASADGIGLAQ